MKKPTAKKPVAPWRHSANCQICKHPQRAEIERLFLEWQGQSKIASEYRLGSRLAVYRHARAMNLFAQRIANTRATLCAVIERGMASRLKVTADIVVRAVIALSKLDSEGRTLERVEQVNSNTAFLNDARWTHGQMLRYAETGEFPGWFDKDPPDTSMRAFLDSGAPN